jgi:hypothetical protein
MFRPMMAIIKRRPTVERKLFASAIRVFSCKGQNAISIKIFLKFIEFNPNCIKA